MNQRDRGSFNDQYPDMGRGQERDLVVAPNEFAYVSDMTKGNINVHVGPMKSSLAGTDQLVNFDYKTKRFSPTDMSRAKETFATAPEGWYLVLKNPAKDGNQPQIGRATNLPDLTVGRKINIPGPVSFALWPGQMVKTVQGHILRSNQYLMVRVYDEQSARENWGKSVVKKADGEETSIDEVISDVDLTMGKMFIIKGTEVSFYIPPTGVEVVAENTNYVRDAVTLERLEYCILKDENGKKRYVKGPDVVFPNPTEIFLKKNNSRKFKAIELSPISGLYIKVIADYDDYLVGDELFITGSDQMIYFPREEHAIMKYGDKDKHYATAIPAGEARYVLNRLTGQIRLEKGPSMFLPDPRNEVLVRRILTPKDVQTWFPGNIEALQYNASLEKMRGTGSEGYLTFDALASPDQRSRGGVAFAAAGATGYSTKQVYEEDDWNSREAATESKMADVLQRSNEYTKPRTITIDSKYEGAVVIDVWTGYAVKIKSKTNQHKVIVGPATYMLEYDEGLEHMELSTGTPKTDNSLMKTAYLRVLNNKVSDVFVAETKDNCQVQISLSYRVNFEGDKEKWFDVENYVKFMTDHMRSFGKALIKKYGIEEFYADPHDIIRNAFLGKAVEGQRPGRTFVENGMRIYEVEVFTIKIGDKKIEQMLVSNQNDLVQQSLQMAQMRRQIEIEKERQDLLRQKEDELLKTSINVMENAMTKDKLQLALDVNREESSTIIQEKKIFTEAKQQERMDLTAKAQLERQLAEDARENKKQTEELKLVLDKIQAEVTAVVEKGKAISPQLIAALQTLGDMEFASKLSDNMSVQAMLGGKSVVEVFQNLIGDNNMAKLGEVLMKRDRKINDEW